MQQHYDMAICFLRFFMKIYSKNKDFYDVFVLKNFNNSGNMFLYIIFNV